MIALEAPQSHAADEATGRNHVAVGGAAEGLALARADQPMVLHVRVVTGHGGGPEKTILNSPRFLRRLGYESQLAYLHPPGDPGFTAIQNRGRALGAEVISVPDRGPLDLTVVWNLARLCRRLKVAVWHGHDYKSNLLGLLIRPFWRMKLVTTLHGWTNLSGRTPLYVRVDKRCLKQYRAAICVSEDLVEDCLKLQVRADRCYLIHNAIDTDDYCRTMPVPEAKRLIGAPADEFLVAAVGRLSAEKGFDLLIRAVANLRRSGRPVGLWIAGDGQEQASLAQLIAELNAGGYVRLLGHVADPRGLYQAADAFALSSIREGLPNVLLEAMALQTPVVATRVAGVPKLITDGHDGLLIAPGDEAALGGAFCRLLDDAHLRDRLGKAGRATIEARYSFARRMEKVVRVYDEVLGRPAQAFAERGEPIKISDRCQP
jgi:glycosyltransferase involved in cell wall biosynthesis